jgi:molecular chaperone GrpE
MFQRTILRQAQAARSVLSTSSPSTASLALRRTTQQQRLPALRPFAPQTTRFYSTEKEAKEGENAETEAENSDAKKLEAKEREVIELKVRTFLSPQS